MQTFCKELNDNITTFRDLSIGINKVSINPLRIYLFDLVQQFVDFCCRKLCQNMSDVQFWVYRYKTSVLLGKKAEAYLCFCVGERQRPKY
jgi:hypothetical protein